MCSCSSVLPTVPPHYHRARDCLNKIQMIPLVVLVLLLICKVQSARILGVFPLLGRSHYILGSTLMRALVEQGHDVTVISPFGEKKPPKGGSYRDVVLTGMLDEVERRRNEINMYEMGELNPFINIPILSYLMSEIGEMTLKHENVQKLIKSEEKFDAVVVEQFFNDAHKALAAHFDGILIGFSTVGANYWVNSLMGNPSPPSYIPDSFLSYSSHMTFIERLINTLIYALQTTIHHLYLYPKQNRVIRNYIPGGPDINDVLYNASLVLLNSHPSFNRPVPLVPNMIEIGGFHVKPPGELPEDLKNFLDAANEGVIYFSMGSNLRSSDLPVDKRNAILRVFSKLKQKILWKWEDDILPGQPENVKLGKWLPQQNIFPHSNMKLFITHGGMLSTIEALYYGVPVLAIPIYGDQKLNAEVAVTSGYGLSLPYKDLSENNFKAKINEILSNPKYVNNAKSRSKVFHDRQVKPLDTALYWIDYVIRHKGASHLRVAALDLPWYKYHLLDVIIALIFITSCILFAFYFILKKLCQKLYSKKKQEKLKEN